MEGIGYSWCLPCLVLQPARRRDEFPESSPNIRKPDVLNGKRCAIAPAGPVVGKSLVLSPFAVVTRSLANARLRRKISLRVADVRLFPGAYPSHDGHDFSDNVGVDVIAQSQESSRRGGAGADKQRSILQDARGTHSDSIPCFDNVQRLSPDRSGKGCGRGLAPAVHREECGVPHVGMTEVTSRSCPKEIADGQAGQTKQERQRFTKKDWDFFKGVANGLQEPGGFADITMRLTK
jgi:hypothetical protein